MSVATGRLYQGEVAASDGCLYCIPFHARRVLKVDLKSEKFELLDLAAKVEALGVQVRARREGRAHPYACTPTRTRTCSRICKRTDLPRDARSSLVFIDASLCRAS